MQVRHTPLETRKLLILAKTEKNHIDEVLDALEKRFKNNIPNLAEFIAKIKQENAKLTQLIARYNDLSDSLFVFHRDEKLQSIFQEAMQVRDNLVKLHLQVMTEIARALDPAIKERKKLILLGLGLAGEYRGNIAKLEQLGRLENVEIGSTDYRELLRSKKILRDEYQYLENLSLAFAYKYSLIQSRYTTELRFIGKFKEHLNADKQALEKAIVSYEKQLVLLRQTLFAACNKLFRDTGNTKRIVNDIQEMIAATHPIQRLPKAPYVDPSDLVTIRQGDVDGKMLGEIRRKFMR
jgi:hypothetical protein